MRRELGRAVAWRRRRRRGLRWRGLGCRRGFFWRRDEGIGGRVLSGRGGVPVGLGFSPLTVWPSEIGFGAKNGTPPRRDTPSPRHPPEMRLRPTLRKPQRLRLYSRQSYIRRQGLRGRRPQQGGSKLQSNERHHHNGSSFGHKLPANAQSHKLL